MGSHWYLNVLIFVIFRLALTHQSNLRFALIPITTTAEPGKYSHSQLIYFDQEFTPKIYCNILQGNSLVRVFLHSKRVWL